MKDWEFLLQKEGDRSWLPLDGPAAEILEGRYRVIGRSRQANTEITVRIDHRDRDSVPPKQRVHTRTHTTNDKGVLVVIPVTQLVPGDWQIQCTLAPEFQDGSPTQGSPTDSSMQGSPTHGLTHSIVLHVLTHETENDDWDPQDWHQPLESPPLNPSAEGSPELPQSDTQAETFSVKPAVVDAAAAQSIQPAQEPTQELEHRLTQAENPPVTLEATLPVPAEDLSPTSSEATPEVTPEATPEAIAPHHRVPNLDPADPEDTWEALEADLSTRFTPPPQLLERAAPGIEIEPDALTSPTACVARTDQAISTTYVIDLEQTDFVANWGDILTIAGRIEVPPPLLQPTLEPSASTSDQFSGSTAVNLDLDLDDSFDSRGFDSGATPWAAPTAIKLTLRDPQTSALILREEKLIDPQPGDIPFCFTLTLPAKVSSHLVIGEIQLLSDDPTTPTLANQAVTITVNPEQLMQQITRIHETLAQTPWEEEQEPLDLPGALLKKLSDDANTLNLSFLQPQVAAKPKRYPSIAGQPLPPQLYQPDPSEAGKRPLELPNFHQPGRGPSLAEIFEDGVVDEFAAPAPLASTDATVDGPESEAPATLPAAESADSALGAAARSALTAPAPLQGEDGLDSASPDSLDTEALDREDRFIDRLSALAGNQDLASELSLQTPTQPAPTASFNDEVVWQESVGSKPQGRQPASASLSRPNYGEVAPVELEEHEPVPTPAILVLTPGDLVAGQPIQVKVQLPDIAPRIYVKLWINDLQTRSLLDGPHWLVDFHPNGHGQLEALSELTVPFGSLSLRFEAIAIEMPSQRESHKAYIDRAAMPPELPDLSLDDFKF